MAACLLGAAAMHGALAVVPLNFGGAAVQYGIAPGDQIEVTLMFEHDEPAPAVEQVTAAEPRPPTPLDTTADMQVPTDEQRLAAAPHVAAPRRRVEQQRAATAVAPATPEAAAAKTGGAGRTLAKPDYLRNPPPKYPAESRKLREEGVVLLKVFVTADGRAGNVQLERSSGYSRLDDAALKAVRRWEFNPARVGPTPVACTVEVPVRFGLN